MWKTYLTGLFKSSKAAAKPWRAEGVHPMTWASQEWRAFNHFDLKEVLVEAVACCGIPKLWRPELLETNTRRVGKITFLRDPEFDPAVWMYSRSRVNMQFVHVEVRA